MKEDTRTFLSIVGGIPLILASAVGVHAVFAPTDSVAESAPPPEAPAQPVVASEQTPEATSAPSQAALASVPIIKPEPEPVVEEPVIEYVYETPQNQPVREDDDSGREFERESDD